MMESPSDSISASGYSRRSSFAAPTASTRPPAIAMPPSRTGGPVIGAPQSAQINLRVIFLKLIRQYLRHLTGACQSLHRYRPDLLEMKPILQPRFPVPVFLPLFHRRRQVAHPFP